MDYSKLRMLTSHESGFISINEDQNQIYLCFKNLLLSFTLHEFFVFRETAKELLVADDFIPFPDGSSRIILRTPNDNINFSFMQRELMQLTEVLDAAYYMQKMHQFIYGN